MTSPASRPFTVRRTFIQNLNHIILKFKLCSLTESLRWDLTSTNNSNEISFKFKLEFISFFEDSLRQGGGGRRNIFFQFFLWFHRLLLRCRLPLLFFFSSSTASVAGGQSFGTSRLDANFKKILFFFKIIKLKAPPHG